MILASALICLAANIFYEARGEPILGQYAVAAVTMNRAGDDPAKVCEVVLARHQFSWTTSRVVATHRGPVLRRAAEPQDAFAWMIALKIARNVLAGNKIDMTHGSTYFHTAAARPYWRAHFRRVVMIGSHIFYREQ
jgi:N-acetylmuramoyl-L-alanine amidase